MEGDSSKEFISSLVTFLQNLCCGLISFEKHMQITGNIFLTIDTEQKYVEYVLNEKVYKSSDNQVDFLSKSFQALLGKQEPQEHVELPSSVYEESVTGIEPIESKNTDVQEDVYEVKDSFVSNVIVNLPLEANIPHTHHTIAGSTDPLELKATRSCDVESVMGSSCLEPGARHDDPKSNEDIYEGPLSFTLSTNQRGNEVLIIDGFQFNYGKPHSLGHVWRCSRHVTNKCKATCKTNPEKDKLICIPGQHNHQKFAIKAAAKGGQKYKQKYKYRPHNHNCPVCSFTCRGPSRLRHHMLKHTGEKPHVCETCGKAFVTKRGVREHILSHTGGDTFVCNICGKPHTAQWRLDKHMMTHSDEKLYKCEHCDFECKSKNSLKYHMKFKHSKEPLQCYKCEICSKTYVNISSFRYHIKTHGEKTFECNVCQKKFYTKILLDTHNRRKHMGEKGHPCDQCDKTFFTITQLQKHKLTHSGERPHVCEICGEAFAAYQTLISHRYRHTGERPWLCQNCGKGFTQAGALKVHKRSCLSRGLIQD